MKSPRQRRRTGRRFEAAGALAVGRVRVWPRLSWRWLRGVLLVLVVLIVAGAVWLGLDSRFYIYRVDVEGAVRVSPDEIFQASGLPRLHVLWARPTEIEARILAALPTLESVQAVCKLPANCTITVVERQPRVMWDDTGQLWWVDTDGFVFAAYAEEQLMEGWLVRGPLPLDEDGQLDEQVRVALTELWASGATISPELEYVPNRGLVLIDERGWRVIVGRGTGMGKRLQLLELLAADLEARGLNPRFVDVRFLKAPYYSLTKDW
jgi:cell division septal protein FtsQ